MSNALTNVVRQHWKTKLQTELEKKLVAMDLARMEDIPDGTTKNIPSLEFQSVGSYTKYTAATASDLNTGNDALVINQTPLVTFAMDEIDEQDNYIDITDAGIDRAAYKLKESIDGKFLSKILDSTYAYDTAGVRVNSGSFTPVALTEGASQNVTATFGTAEAFLVNEGADPSRLVIVADPFGVQKIEAVGIEKGTAVSDDNLTRGFKGKFMGMEVYSATNLTASVVLDLATNPAAGDTVTIKGATFTFASPVGTTAGNVLIGASADASAQNLVAAVNGAAGAGTTYVEISSKNRAKFSGSGIVATDGTDLVTFVSTRGSMLASSSMTNASNDFRAETVNSAVMEKGAILMALRREIGMKVVPIQGTLADQYLIYSRYGVLMPQEGKDRTIVVKIQGTAAEA